MTDQSPRRNLPADQSKTVADYSDLADAEKAFEAYTAMIAIGRNNPTMGENKYYTDLLKSAYDRFLARFEAI